jgi:hypothetical protein
MLFATQRLKSYWKPPFRYEAEGTMIVDANGARILDVRGWGHLTGKGSHGIHETNAESIQDEIGRDVATLLNDNWPKKS